MTPQDRQTLSTGATPDPILGGLGEGDSGGSLCQQRVLISIADHAKQHGVSIRTARRMLKADYFQSKEWIGFYGQTIPARTIGKDGKSYPHQRRRYVRQIETDRASFLIRQGLNYARHGLKKADKIACEDGFQDRDIEALKSVATLANEMLSRWMEAGQ